jgi:Cu/Ag efflux protein CusF
MANIRSGGLMRNPVALGLAIGLLAAGAANAQFGGGGGGGGGGGHRHGGGGGQGGQPSGGGSSSSASAPSRAPIPVSDSDIVGVIKAIDPTSGRITIAYEPVLARNWPAGTMPFAVAKPDIMTGVSVGEKVRFRVDSQQIVELGPYQAPPAPTP